MKKIYCIFLILLSFQVIFCKKVSILHELIKPGKLEINGQFIYVLDGATVFTYSLKDYKFLFKFGRKGNGPGELTDMTDYPIIMQKSKNGILLKSFNKLISFDFRGIVLKEKKIPYFAFQVVPVEDNLVLSKFVRSSSGGSELQVLLVDQNFKTLKKIYTTALLNNHSKGKIAYPFLSVIIRQYKNKIYIVDQQENFKVRIYSSKGDFLKIININYQQIKITKDYITKKKKWLQLQPELKAGGPRLLKMFYFLDYLPGIKNYHIEKNGIFIETNRKKDDLTEFYQLDFNGKINRKSFLSYPKAEQLLMVPQTNFKFYDNSYFYLKDNFDDESWELHRIKLDNK